VGRAPAPIIVARVAAGPDRTHPVSFNRGTHRPDPWYGLDRGARMLAYSAWFAGTMWAQKAFAARQHPGG